MNWLRLFIVAILPIFSYAQPYGNEWINYNQQYLKIPVTESGIHKIEYSTLNTAMANIGVSLSAIDPRNIQVFARGEEQAIDVIGEADGSFDPADYVLFYGEKNDGWYDAGLYENPTSSRINPYYSLFSDTQYYFITWNNLPANFRFKASENINFTGKTAESFYYGQGVGVFSNIYSYGAKDNNGVSFPFFDVAEGYASHPYSTTSTRTTYIYTRNIYQQTTAPPTTFKTAYAGASNASGASINHRTEVSVNNTQIIDDSYQGYELREKTLSIPSANLNNSRQRVDFTALALNPAPATDFSQAGYAFFEFPHNNSLNGERFVEMWIPASTDTSYFNLTNYSQGSVTYVYDIDLGIKCKTVQSGSNLQFLIPPGPKRKCVFAGTGLYSSISGIQSISNKSNNQGYFTDFNSISPDSAFILISHPELWNAATQYSNYKTQTGHNSLLVSVLDLYDQFSFGIHQHPLSIKNFIKFLVSIKPNAPPKYLLLTGKSVKSISTRRNAANTQMNKVPTIGTPPADNLFTVDISGSTINFPIPVGRIAAHTDSQILDYLEKVKKHEAELSKSYSTIEEAIWNKRAIHFSGGNSDFEQRVFDNYLNGYKTIYSGPKLNGVVHTFKRKGTGSSGDIEFDGVNNLLNNGVSLITFFGHGSGGQLGINLSDPEEYSNAGRFPIFIANSCNVGDYHLPNENSSTFNERWALAKNSGAIGFISSTSIGYASNLNRYSSGLYSGISQENYTSSIGQIMGYAMSTMNKGNSFDLRTSVEMNLHGDPSLKLNVALKPDYAIEKKYIVAPEVISADESTFEIIVPVYNLGLGTDSIIDVQLTWQFPNGKDSVILTKFTDNELIKDITFNLLIDEKLHIGENSFSVTVNPNSTVDEVFPVLNNTVNGVRVNITSDDIIPIWPKNFAIVPSSDLRLAASTADLFAPGREFIFELDITDEFNSNMKKTTTIKSAGGLVTWKPTISFAPDSIVYFWRCSPKKEKPEDLKWRESSFQIIPNKEGWSQYDFNQFKNNGFSSIQYLKPEQELQFTNGNISIVGNIISRANVKWSLEGEVQGRVGVCQGRPSILVTVIDPVTLEPWQTRYFDGTPAIEYNANRNYGNYNDPSKSTCGEDNKFMFRVQDPGDMDAMVDLITNQVPDSFYLLIMNGNYAYFRDTTYWKDRHYKVFEDLGSDSIKTIDNLNPMIMFAQKGNPSKTLEVVSTDPQGALSISASINSTSGQGTMKSAIIGPSKNWNHLSWNHNFASAGDSISLTVSGINLEGEERILYNFLESETEVENLEMDYSVLNNYNYLRFSSFLSDLKDYSAPQFKKWQLYFDESPEFAINPASIFNFYRDTVLQGQPVILETEIVNASRILANDLKIRTYLRGKSNETLELPVQTIKELKAWEAITDSFLISTEKLGGTYTLTVELNPLDTNWQPEGKHFNNLIQKTFYVKSDKLNPLLDVTFDGIHILDGDIVSARPEIRMTLNDENVFMPIDDTSNFEVYLTYPDKSQRRVYFLENGTENMLFEPANGKKNMATIQYNPILTTDGDYLLSVNATDGNGNRSGDRDFEISFEVINRSTITHVMNYPNPFTTGTQFVFTLTGYKIPDYFRVQILTISGRVIKEIDKYELGHIHIGRNITEYAWDGTDEFGDRLANGVYFYRVITKIDGETVEHRNSGADSYFKKEFGKMYLMR